MKKVLILTTVVLFAAVTSSSAQIQKGNVLVGGDISKLTLGLNKGGFFSFALNPKAAWFIQDNLAVGGYVNFGLSTSKGAGTNVDYGVGPLARYYLSGKDVNVLKHSRFFLEGNFGIEGTNPASGENTNGLGLGIGPGWTYFVTPNIGLEALLKYQGIVGFGQRATSSNLGLGVGFQIYLPSSRVKATIENPNR